MIVVLISTTEAFVGRSMGRRRGLGVKEVLGSARQQSTAAAAATAGSSSSSVSSITAQMKEMREQLLQDEQAQLLMQGLRGSNINDDDSAMDGLQMRLVDVRQGKDELPKVYDPVLLDAYFDARPGAVFTRFWQLLSASSSFLASVVGDAVRGTLEENEVKRAIMLRDTITSLGPFYIKLGQALSIRPDILSPRAMVELQKLCDKVTP